MRGIGPKVNNNYIVEVGSLHFSNNTFRSGSRSFLVSSHLSTNVPKDFSMELSLDGAHSS